VTPFETLSAINTDLMFRRTAIRIAESQCEYAPGGYNYLFTWKSRALGGKLGACHALEIGFIFGNYEDSFCGSGPAAEKLSEAMQDGWTRFAATGNPSCGTLGEWPKYCNGRATMILDGASRLAKAFKEEERRIWENVEELKYSNMP